MAERRPPIRYIRGGLGLPMFRVRRPPEWGVEPVPHGLRVLRTFDLFVLWSSLGIGLLVLAAGTLLVFIPFFGAVVAALALGGPLAVIRAWLEKFAIWLVYASTAAIGIALIWKGPDLGLRYAPFSGTTSLLLALDLVIAMPISWWPLISDYNRFARSSKDSWVGTTAGYTIANTVFYMLGAGLMALGIASGQPNFLAVIGLLRLGAFPLVIILVDETDNAFSNVYSTAVSIQNLAPKRRQLGFIVAATLIAMAGAAFLWSRGEGIGGSYEGFLFLIGGLFAPLLGVVIADSFVVRRGTYAAEEFFDGARPWRWAAVASWVPGAALYFVIVIFALPVGASLPSFALAAGLQVVFSRLESSLTRPTSAASGGDP